MHRPQFWEHIGTHLVEALAGWRFLLKLAHRQIKGFDTYGSCMLLDLLAHTHTTIIQLRVHSSAACSTDSNPPMCFTRLHYLPIGILLHGKISQSSEASFERPKHLACRLLRFFLATNLRGGDAVCPPYGCTGLEIKFNFDGRRVQGQTSAATNEAGQTTTTSG